MQLIFYLLMITNWPPANANGLLSQIRFRVAFMLLELKSRDCKSFVLSESSLLLLLLLLFKSGVVETDLIAFLYRICVMFSYKFKKKIWNYFCFVLFWRCTQADKSFFLWPITTEAFYTFLKIRILKISLVEIATRHN